MEIANVIDSAGILHHKAIWEKEYQRIQKLAAQLQQDIVNCQHQMQALSGACQACDTLLEVLKTSMVPVNGSLAIEDAGPDQSGAPV